MRKIFFFLLPAVMLFAAGCKDKNGADDVNALTVNPELITCPATGGDYELTVSSPNGAWTATPSESWIRVTPTSGEQGSATIRVKISVNKESVASKGSIVFKSGEETVELPVSRAAKAAPYLRVVSEKELNTPKEGGTYTVQIESNIKWSASSNAGWAKVNKGVTVNNDNITITVDAATMPQETTARIIVSPYGEGYEAGSDTVYITRGSTEATSLSVDPTEITAPENGGSFTVNVSSNAKWRVWKTWDMDWVTISGSAEGNGSGSFGISVEAATSMDAVSGILTIEEVRSDSYKPVVTQVAVSRKGKPAAELSVEPLTINAPAQGGEFPVTIKSNYPWTANATLGSFFSLSTKSGDGDATMIITVKSATSEKESTGTIVINSSFGNESARINIKREGIILRLSMEKIDAPADGGTYKVKVTSNSPWNISSTDEMVATVSLTGNESFSIKVLPADVAEISTARIKVSTEDGLATKYVDITRQAVVSHYVAKPFSVTSNKKVYFSSGNLQYKPTTGVWQFALRQYYRCTEYVNNHRSSKTNEFFDIFGWGASGYRQYYPYLNPVGNESLLPTADIANTSYDWGVSCPISNGGNAPGMWRTLTSNEWKYVLLDRKNAQLLLGFGRITSGGKTVEGAILLPDEWVKPDGVNFVTSVGNYTTNSYSEADWNKMESAGAVFLPTRSENVQMSIYWTSTGYKWHEYAGSDRYSPYEFIITPDIVEANLDHESVLEYGTAIYHDYYYSYENTNHVRLVRDAN